MIEWKSIRRILASAALLLAVPGTALAVDCVQTYGIEHCAIGKARLGMTSSGLEVTDFGTAGIDGVSLRFDRATSWEVDAEVKGNATRDASLVMTPFIGGFPIHPLILQLIRSQLVLSPQSTKMMSVKVLQDSGSGTYAAVADGIAWTASLSIEELEPGDGDDYSPLTRGTRLGFSTQTGHGIYSFTFSTPVVVVLPDGRRVRGDRLELIEEGTGGGFSPTFDGLHLTGTVDALTITGETYRR